MGTNDLDLNEANQSIPSRRTVLRTAAWSVPAVSVAAAAPAFALSGPAVLDIVTATADWGANYNVLQLAPLTYALTVKNTGGTQSGPVTVTLRIPGGGSDVYYRAITTQPTGGWTAATSDDTSDGLTYHHKLTLTLPAGLAPGASSSTVITMEMRDPNIAGGNQRQQGIAHSANGSATDGQGGTTTDSLPVVYV